MDPTVRMLRTTRWLLLITLARAWIDGLLNELYTKLIDYKYTAHTGNCTGSSELTPCNSSIFSEAQCRWSCNQNEDCGGYVYQMPTETEHYAINQEQTPDYNSYMSSLHFWWEWQEKKPECNAEQCLYVRPCCQMYSLGENITGSIEIEEPEEPAGSLLALGAPRRSGSVCRARFMTGGGYRLLASANFGELVLGCSEAKFCK